MLYAIVAVLAVILDQWVKFYVADNLAVGETRQFIAGLVSLTNVHNDGAAFSFLSGANAGMIFVILAAVVIVAVIIGVATNFISGPLAKWCAVLVAAGGAGNAIDRLLYSYVQDMFQFEIGFLKNFPVFNVADIFITVCCFIFILCIIFGGRDDEDEYEDEYEEEEVAAAPVEDEDDVASSVRRRAMKNYVPHVAEDTFDEEEEEEEERTPLFRNRQDKTGHARTTQKERREKVNDEYEQYKAKRDARQRAADYETSSAGYTAPAYDSSNPFAEWEAAVARTSGKTQEEKPAVKAAGTSVKPAAAAAAPAAAAQPVKKVEAPVVEKAPEVKKSSDEFSLDDILAEFR